jgi:hypothetical protein
MKHIESNNQQALFQWAAYSNIKYPELSLMYHIPNGGKRNVREAARLKKEGVKSGIPDICLPVARGIYHGLYIELKAGKGKASDNQKDWIDRLTNQGYKAEVCIGWEQAKDAILEYLEGLK